MFFSRRTATSSLKVTLADVDTEIRDSIARGNRFFSLYINKGSIPYGDHNPATTHSNNGKNGSAAVMFGVQDRVDGAAFFSRMVVASYGELEMGHTGNYFGYLWSALGAGRARLWRSQKS